jgi:two-component system, NtrC family, nitrogen regulation response regulator GlnG
MPHILIVDDEPSICWSLKKLLQSEGHSVDTASSAESGLSSARKHAPDTIVLDVRMPGISGLDAIPKFQELLGEVPIVLITAFGDLPTAIEAYQKRVTDYLTKPFDLERASEVIKGALASVKRPANQSPTRSHAQVPFDYDLVGQSPAMQEVFKKIALAASSDVPVLITGESGTGKELAAAAIHMNSARRNRSYIPIALPALNPTLIESELFGHVKGAFTGANEDREGLFAMASGGSVLLDEIGDLPLPQQVKLLRVLEQGHFTAVGDVRPRKCDVRIIAATHQQLPSLIAQEGFRRDLYYRLAVFEIAIPPLRDRLEDIPILCAHMLSRMGYSESSGAVSAATYDELKNRRWIGNVRELRNTLEHAALVARGSQIHLHHLPPPQAMLAGGSLRSNELETLVEAWAQSELKRPDQNDSGIFDRFLAVVEPILIRQCLDATKGNRANAAQLLGMHRATLREKLRRYGVSDE